MDIQAIADYSTIISTIFALFSLIISFLVLRQVNSISMSFNSNNINNNSNVVNQKVSGNGNRSAGGNYNE